MWMTNIQKLFITVCHLAVYRIQIIQTIQIIWIHSVFTQLFYFFAHNILT